VAALNRPEWCRSVAQCIRESRSMSSSRSRSGSGSKVVHRKRLSGSQKWTAVIHRGRKPTPEVTNRLIAAITRRSCCNITSRIRFTTSIYRLAFNTRRPQRTPQNTGGHGRKKLECENTFRQFRLSLWSRDLISSWSSRPNGPMCPWHPASIATAHPLLDFAGFFSDCCILICIVIFEHNIQTRLNMHSQLHCESKNPSPEIV